MKNHLDDVYAHLVAAMEEEEQSGAPVSRGVNDRIGGGGGNNPVPHVDGYKRYGHIGTITSAESWTMFRRQENVVSLIVLALVVLVIAGAVVSYWATS